VKRSWWIVLAGVVLVASLSAGLRAVVLNGGPSIPDLRGWWDYTGRVTATDVDGEREKGKVQGSFYIDQEGPYVQTDVWLDGWDLEFYGMVGPRRLAAVAMEGEDSERYVLEARVGRKAQGLRGRITGVETYDGEGMFVTVSFKASRAAGAY